LPMAQRADPTAALSRLRPLIIANEGGRAVTTIPAAGARRSIELLTARIGVAHVGGVQAGGVGACVKHVK
jgi:hypothetical protein